MTTLEIYLIVHFVCAVVGIIVVVFSQRYISLGEIVSAMIFGCWAFLIVLIAKIVKHSDKNILDIRPKGER